jgi:hypothetical protein
LSPPITSQPPCFAEAFNIYANGKNAKTSNGSLVSLGGLAANDFKTSPFALPYGVGQPGPFFLDAWVMALNGTSFLSQATSRAGALYATVRSSIPMLNAMAELDAGMFKTFTKQTTASSHVDKAWALWAGNGNTSCSLLRMASEAAAFAQTGVDARAESVGLFLSLQAAAQAGDGDAYVTARNKLITRGIIVPGIQQVLRYALEMDYFTDGAAQAAAYAYYRNIRPLIQARSKATDAAILAAINIGDSPQASAYSTIQRAFTTVVAELDLDWTDMGILAPNVPVLDVVPEIPPRKCFYIGNYRIQSVVCRGQYLAFPLNCGSNAVNLRRRNQALDARTIWKFNGTSVSYEPIRATRKCPSDVLAANTKLSMGTSGIKWKYNPVPIKYTTCAQVNLIAQGRSSKKVGGAKYLAVRSDCKGFRWTTKGDSSEARFILNRL